MQPTRATRWFPAFLLIVIASMIVAIVVSAIVQSKLLSRDIERHQVIADASIISPDVPSNRTRVEVVAVRRHGWVQALELWLLEPRQKG